MSGSISLESSGISEALLAPHAEGLTDAKVTALVLTWGLATLVVSAMWISKERGQSPKTRESTPTGSQLQLGLHTAFDHRSQTNPVFLVNDARRSGSFSRNSASDVNDSFSGFGGGGGGGTMGSKASTMGSVG